MRALLLGMLAACGASPVSPTAPPRAPSTEPAVAHEPEPVDALAALADDPQAPIAWLAPGSAQLELGGPVIEGPGPAAALRVRIIDEHGGHVRLAIELAHARFAVWSARDRLYAVLTREVAIAAPAGRSGAARTTLKAGTRVARLAHDAKDKRTQVRFVGALEAETWVPDDALAESGPARSEHGRMPTGRKTLIVMPGAVVRAEPAWQAMQLAVAGNAYFVDIVNELDDGWHEVSYVDSNLEVRGFISTRLPPGKTHPLAIDPDTAPVKMTPNAKVASGTCLFAKAGGDAVGYVVGEQDADLEDAGRGWWTLALDTPWGVITFAARGPSRTELAACAPVPR